MILRYCLILCLVVIPTVFLQGIDQSQQQNLNYANQNQAPMNPNVNLQMNNNPMNNVQQQQNYQNQGANELPSKNLAGHVRKIITEKSPTVLISETEECRADVERICPVALRSSNYNILTCLAQRKDDTDLTDECHTYIWDYKVKMSTDPRFTPMLEESCKKELKTLIEQKLCGSEEETRKNEVSCLMLYKHRLATDGSGDSNRCIHMLDRLSVIIFSDYRLIKPFFEKCKNDVTKFKCGSIDIDQRAEHSQGYTIECLEERINEVEPECKEVIEALAESQAHDIKSDRAAFFACIADIKHFCSEVTGGTGLIYQCLMDNIDSPEMTPMCKKVIRTREKLIVEDPKVSFPIREKCMADLDRFKGECNYDDLVQGHSKMASMLLCLEQKQRSGNPLTSECVMALKGARRMLMSDYELNPGIVKHCGQVITDYCDGGLQKGGKTLHCLMKLGKSPTKSFNLEEEYPKCFESVEFLIRSTNPREDVTIDKVLMDACKPVLDENCRDSKGRLDKDPVGCLFDKIEDRSMTDQCAEVLLEISYFASRDWALDRNLYRACNKDAQYLCDAKRWANIKDHAAHGEVFACLYRHINHEEQDHRLSEQCTLEVVRVMKERAVAVGLNPFLEYQCRQDLAQYCSDLEITKAHKELECLQDIYSVESDKSDVKLSPKCKAALKNYTKVETEEIEINRKLFKSCKPMIEKYCAEERRATKTLGSQGKLFECMIENKNMRDVEDICYYGIEHMQLIQLKDFEFDRSFKRKCKADVGNLCPKAKSKDEVVSCLSQVIRDDKIQGRTVRVSEECQHELQRPLKERYEDLKLDRTMFKVCKVDVDRFCSRIKSGGGRLLECLKDHEEDLSVSCRRKLFEREEVEFEEPEHIADKDFVLNKACKQMIAEYCEDEENVLKCLWKHRQAADFDEKCSRVVHKRMIIKGEDVRLNADLFKACAIDIKTQCKDELDAARRESQNENKLESYQGAVINCLRLRFAEKKLSDKCNDQVRQFIRASAQEWKMDFRLRIKCGKIAREMCTNEKPNKVEECLKDNYASGKINDENDPEFMCREEIKRILDEGAVDINADPILQKTCSLDIDHLCPGVTPGQGRQIGCLMKKFHNNDGKTKMTVDCQKMLRERLEMWSLAGDRIHTVETLSDVMVQIGNSSNRHYFLTIFGMLVSVIFFGGLLFGRVTKRVAREVKSR